jgi:RNA polymerase sigma factor for flagellar operon FliA
MRTDDQSVGAAVGAADRAVGSAVESASAPGREGSEGARREVTARDLDLVEDCARRLHRRLPAHVSRDELGSAGCDGLMAAVRAYDPDRGVAFETYARRRITGAMLDWLRSVDGPTRSQRRFQRRERSAVMTACQRLGRPPTPSEVAREMRLPMEEYAVWRRRLEEKSSISLDALTGGVSRASGAPIEVRDIAHPRQRPPWWRIQREGLRQYLCRGLSRIERMILLLYYYDELTMAETGEAIGLSESRVCQVHGAVIDKLRARFGAHREEILAR